MLEAYRDRAKERAALGIPPLPLNAQQTTELCELLKTPPEEDKEDLLMLLRDRVPPGVDEAAYVKAGFLTAVAKGEIECPLISPQGAIELLGTMIGGYNVQSLIELLKSRDTNRAAAAATALSKTLLVFDAFNDVLHLADTNPYAKQILDAWANAAWFIDKPKVPKEITVTVFKVPGETNTDDLSPAPHATT
ncbi:aconitate hydratase B, partial [Lusitaniella coriacea LEGE 07157]|nr:aconitate hydratase B [Lusitaniella coriacea LEGE 07157]